MADVWWIPEEHRYWMARRVVAVCATHLAMAADPACAARSITHALTTGHVSRLRTLYGTSEWDGAPRRMTVFLIDRDGTVQRVETQHVPVRMVKQTSFSARVVENVYPVEANIVEYTDGAGLLTGDDTPILTPDGGTVPFHRWPGEVFKRGDRLAYNVLLSRAEAAHFSMREDRGEYERAWKLAQPALEAVGSCPVRRLEVIRTFHHDGEQMIGFIVLAEQRLVVKATLEPADV